MKKNLRHELARQLLPGYGFFGGREPYRLSVNIAGTIDFLQIAVQSGVPNYLNLNAIRFFDANGKLYNPSDIIRTARMSSVFSDADSTDVLDNLLKGQSIHSGCERYPMLQIELNQPVKVASVGIYNRIGLYGKRSRNLLVNAWEGQEEIVCYRNSSNSALMTIFDRLISHLDYQLPESLTSINQVYRHAARLQRDIASALQSGHVLLDKEELISLLPMYEEDPLVTESVLVFMGGLIAQALENGREIQTADLQEFKSILSTPNRIEKAVGFTQKILRQSAGNNVNIICAKHTIGYSKLLDSKEKYVKVLRHVSDELAAWGLQSMLCYGTLLGATRDAGFIPHDDDVDVLYIDYSSSHQDMMNNRESMKNRFSEAGYKIWDSGSNFHVTPAGHTVGVDLFPCWISEGNTCLMMERYKYRTIPTDILLPVSKITLYGEEFSSPNNADSFLSERYGNNWGTPDPFHEWPWALQNVSTWPKRRVERSLQLHRTVMIAWGQHVPADGGSPPKNSPSLIKKAIHQEYDAVELDIRLSSDGVFVLGHDDTLTTTEGKKVTISRTSAKELENYSLGEYKGEANNIVSLETALSMLGNKFAHLDPRIPHASIKALRETIDKVGFDPAKIIFCGYGDDCVEQLVAYFPESVVLYKYYGSYMYIDDFVLDELCNKQVDGLMLFWPMHNENCDEFMDKIKERNLQVLFYVHGSWPARGEVDNPDVSLQKMIDAKVDYVTSTASNVETFKRLVASDLAA